MQNGSRPFVSAVVCIRPGKIGNAVGRVLANTFPDFGLTVIDQSTSDRTEQIVRGIGFFLPERSRTATTGANGPPAGGQTGRPIPLEADRGFLQYAGNLR